MLKDNSGNAAYIELSVQDPTYDVQIGLCEFARQSSS
jgi:hypothetical protein